MINQIFQDLASPSRLLEGIHLKETFSVETLHLIVPEYLNIEGIHHRHPDVSHEIAELMRKITTTTLLDGSSLAADPDTEGIIRAGVSRQDVQKVQLIFVSPLKFLYLMLV